MYKVEDEMMDKYMLWAARIPQLETYIRDCIISQIDNLNTLVIEKKYSPTVWLEQFNIDAKNPDREERITKLAKDLKINIFTATNKDKAEIGFFLYCDYLKELHTKIKEGKKLVDCEEYYVCHWRTGEVLHLFGNPLSLEHLKAAYKNNLKVLKEKRNALPTEESEKIIECDNAIKMLKSLKEKLIEEWDAKINPLNPSIDDRKIKDLPLANPILKSLAKEEESTTQSLLNPAE